MQKFMSLAPVHSFFAFFATHIYTIGRMGVAVALTYFILDSLIVNEYIWVVATTALISALSMFFIADFGHKLSRKHRKELDKQLDDTKEQLKVYQSRVVSLQEELEQRKQQRIKESHSRSKLLANLSHDFRSSLNSVLVLSKLLEDNTEKNLDNRQIKHVKTINRAGTDLLDIVSSLQSAALLDSIDFSVGSHPFDLMQLKEKLLRNYESTANDNGILFAVDIATNLKNAELKTDYRLFNLLLESLLVHAVRSTKKGGINLYFDYESHNGKDELIITLQDTGGSVNPNTINILNTPLDSRQILVNTASDKYTLNLVIVNKSVTLLGGRISAECDQDIGSRITVHIPNIVAFKEEQDEIELGLDPEEHIEPKAPDEHHKKTISSILIIEDDNSVYWMLESLLSNHDIVCSHAPNATMANHMMNLMDYDAILCDLKLPDMQGAALIGFIAARKRADVPMWVLSGTPLSPQERGEIDRVTESIVFKSSHEITMALTEEIANYGSRAAERESENKSRILIVDDDERIIHSVLAILNNRKYIIDVAHNGKEAVEACKHQAYQLVVMDVSMPVMDGFAAMASIRNELNLTMPIMAITGHASMSQRERSIIAGATSYMSKPLHVEKLQNRVEALLNNSYSNVNCVNG